MKHSIYTSWAVALLVTTFCVSVVVPIVMYFNEPDDWPQKVTVGASLTASLAFPISFVLGWQRQRYARVAQELERLVNQDRLTKVASREFFFRRMEDGVHRKGISLMVDIDHFKSINDAHGHLAGDQVIRRVAQVLQENCRPEDIVCRFGGEEFVIFLNAASPETGALAAERIRRSVAESGVNVEGHPISVTVSIGGAMKLSSQDVTEAIRNADAALYRAKRAGRNRVELDWLPATHPGALEIRH